jgi:hypothetical protein
MELDVGASIVAGLVGGGVMSVLLYMGIAMIPAQMKMNLFQMLGTMMVPAGTMAYVVGAMMHSMMSVVFGLIHGLPYVAFDIDSGFFGWGLAFGFGHWIVTGIGLGMLPIMHPTIRRGEIQAPGFFAMSYPRMTAMGFFMLHIVFGVVTALVYDGII